MKKEQNKGMSAGTIGAIGAGAVAVGAAAYYFLGPNAKKNKKTAAKWTLEAKTKIVKELKRAKEVSETVYNKVVDDVVTPYITKGATLKEVDALKEALKKDWKHIVAASKKTAMGEAKEVKSKARKTISKIKSKAKKAVN